MREIEEKNRNSVRESVWEIVRERERVWEREEERDKDKEREGGERDKVLGRGWLLLHVCYPTVERCVNELMKGGEGGG